MFNYLVHFGALGNIIHPNGQKYLNSIVANSHTI